MDKLQIKKSLEKTKASLVFAAVFLILSIPTLIKVLPQTAAFSAVSACLVIIAFIYKRILRLNRKISSI